MDDAHIPSAVLLSESLHSQGQSYNRVVANPTKIHVFLFPFAKGIVGCANAIWLQHMNYSTDDTMGALYAH